MNFKTDIGIGIGIGLLCIGMTISVSVWPYWSNPNGLGLLENVKIIIVDPREAEEKTNQSANFFLKHPLPL